MPKDKYVVLPKKHTPITVVQKRLIEDLILQATRIGEAHARGERAFNPQAPSNIIMADSREQLEKYLQKLNRRIFTLEAELKHRRGMKLDNPDM